jgi:phosphatidylglycerophosphate synthase
MLWLQERAGPWILVVGLARYAFIAAGRLDARFAAELPASERRRNAAAATMAAVAIALIPITPNGLALHAALLATGVTILSFLIDIIFLLKKYRKYE